MKASGRIAFDAMFVLIPAALVLAVVGCGTLPTTTRDGQRERGENGPPPLNASPSYETATASIDVPVPLTAFSRWFDRTGAPNLGSFLKSTAGVPGVVRSEPLVGMWHDPGDRRKLTFVDGGSVFEQILDKGSRRTRVELWDLRNDTGRYIAYALETFDLSETPTGTRVAWTTDFEPKAQPPDGWMIRAYVRGDYRDFMQRGLNAMAVRAVLDVGAKQPLQRDVGR